MCRVCRVMSGVGMVVFCGGGWLFCLIIGGLELDKKFIGGDVVVIVGVGWWIGLGVVVCVLLMVCLFKYDWCMVYFNEGVYVVDYFVKFIVEVRFIVING